MLEMLQQFSFRDLWSPLFLVVIIIIANIYLWFVGSFRHRWKESEEVRPFRKFLFILGLFLIYVGFGSPLFVVGHFLFSAHMIMMAIVYVFVPPLLYSGLPAWLLRPLGNIKFLHKFKFLVNPIFGVLAFTALFSFYHFPEVHDYVMTHYTIHVLYYIALGIAAMLQWWTIMCPVPEMDRLSHLQKMGIVFLSGALLTPACALIIFAGTPVYATYSDPIMWTKSIGFCFTGDPAQLLDTLGGPPFFPWFSLEEDQQLGGIAMKMLQESVLIAFLFYLFGSWFRAEGRNDAELGPDALNKV